MKYQQNLYLGIVFIITAEFIFTSMAALVKWVSVYLPNESIVFFRHFFVMLILLPWVLSQGITKIHTQHFRFHLVRSLSGLTAMYCLYYAYANMPLAEATVIKMTMPFFLPIISFWWLSESVSKPTRWAIVVGFLGVLVILKPGFVTLSLVALIALLGSFFSALSKSAIRRMAKTEASLQIVFYFTLICMTVSAIPLSWAWVTPSWQAWMLLLLIAIFSLIAQLLMTQAYQRAKTAQIGPFSYVAVIFATLYGWFFWHETIDLWFLIGTGFIMVAGLLITQNNRNEKSQS
jgi:drug/metabolite transporter (DMT)-like permease